MVKKETKQEVRAGKRSAEKKEVIAFRKACKATGTGLSHYILMDRKDR